MKINKYFCACNSIYGFKSFFEDVFFNDSVKKRYIIKGGPGTGKSTLMKLIADNALSLGYNVDLYYCSSDPDSLDGVFIKDLDICIFDGTAPHSYDLRYPGAFDTAVYMDRFWDEKILCERKNEIKSLFGKCSELYKRGYSALAAAGRIRSNLYSCIYSHIDMEKIKKAAKNYAFRFSGGSGTPKMRMISSLGGKGAVTLTDNFTSVKNLYYVQDRVCIAPVLLENILKFSSGEVEVLLDPIDPEKIQGLYFPTADVLFTSSIELVKNKKHKTIHSSRFTDGFLCENKAKIRFEVKYAQALIDHGCSYFTEAKKVHDILEQIYISAMDFEAKESWTHDFISEIFCQ